MVPGSATMVPSSATRTSAQPLAGSATAPSRRSGGGCPRTGRGGPRLPGCRSKAEKENQNPGFYYDKANLRWVRDDKRGLPLSDWEEGGMTKIKTRTGEEYTVSSGTAASNPGDSTRTVLSSRIVNGARY